MRPRWIRRKLREIRYYSAIRPSTAWSRAADIALLAGFLAAWPVAWAMDRGFCDSSTQARVSGKLYAIADGSIWAATTSALSPKVVPVGAVPHGSFDLSILRERRGWPFASSLSHDKPALTVEVYVPRQTLDITDLAPGSALHEAIADADVGDRHEDRVLAALRGPTTWAETRAEVHLLGWVGNTVMWALFLPLVAWLTVGLARVVSLPIGQRRHDKHRERVRDGRCCACNYDLRGSPFSSHCPECGAVL